MTLLRPVLLLLLLLVLGRREGPLHGRRLAGPLAAVRLQVHFAVRVVVAHVDVLVNAHCGIIVVVVYVALLVVFRVGLRVVLGVGVVLLLVVIILVGGTVHRARARVGRVARSWLFVLDRGEGSRRAVAVAGGGAQEQPLSVDIHTAIAVTATMDSTVDVAMVRASGGGVRTATAASYAATVQPLLLQVL